MMKSKKVIIGGGGTGGHVFPAISIAQALQAKDPDMEFLFVGARNRIEMEKVPEAGYRVIGLPISGFKRKLSLSNIGFFSNLLRSMIKSYAIVRRFKPDIAVGVGGYASGPILRAASKKKVPIVIQEQNSFAGITNRILGSEAKKVFVAYDGLEKFFPKDKIVLTGNPVREGILRIENKTKEALDHFGIKDKKPVVLIVGGSLGAGSINKCLAKKHDELTQKYHVIWQTGKVDYPSIEKQLKNQEQKNLRVMPFIAEIDHAFSVADMIVSRAGAGTISELMIVGKPAILVPSPQVAEDHQTKNAKALVKEHAAIHLKDSDVYDKLIPLIHEVLKDKEKMNELSKNIKKLARPNSSEQIAEEILALL